MVKSRHTTWFMFSVVIFVMGMPRCVPLAPVVYFNKEGGVLCTNQFHCPENRVHVSIGGTYHCSLTEKRPYQHLCWHGRKSFKACFTPPFLSLYQNIRNGGDFVVFLTAFLEPYFASTTEVLISFSVSLRSNAPPSATLTRSSYSVPSDRVSTAAPVSSVIDHSSLPTSASFPSAP